MVAFELTRDSTGHKLVKVTGVKNLGRTVTVLCRASNELVGASGVSFHLSPDNALTERLVAVQTLGEADRSLHDALCVIRSLVKKRCAKFA
jgi:T-complex protein 1 subunit delta